MTKQCPKCGHKRNLDDGLPDTECPKCGIVYARFVPVNVQQKKKCQFCGEEILMEAVKCKHCQTMLNQSDTVFEKIAKPKKKHGILYQIARVFVILFLIGFISVMYVTYKTTQTTVKPTKATQVTPKVKKTKIFKEYDTIAVGYTHYTVWQSWWSEKLSDNKFINREPDAMFLFVELDVRNKDKKARIIPPFQLIDQNGLEYDSSSAALLIDNSIRLFKSLNPNVKKRGFIVFDVPQGNQYKLKVSGGYWSGAEALIQLSPPRYKY